MSARPEVIVMADSPEAATLQTVTGWVSRDGRFFGDDERTARYSGCTHRPCEDCGAPTPKSWTACRECREKREVARYFAMEVGEWDGVQMVYSQTADCFFNSPDDAAEWFADEHGEDAYRDMRLVLCDPQRASEIDSDHFQDILPEDGELPDDLAEALDVFNAAIQKCGVVSWAAGDLRIATPGASGDGAVPLTEDATR